MLSIASAVGNIANVSGARAFLRIFAADAGRMQGRLVGIAMQEAPVAPVAPVVADNAPVAPVAPVVVDDVPVSSPIFVRAVAAHATAPAAATTPAVSIQRVHVAAPVVTPLVTCCCRCACTRVAACCCSYGYCYASEC